MEQYDAAWFRSVLDAMHDMVLVKGPQSNLLWANQAFLTYYGMTEAELGQIVDAPHSDPDDTVQYVKDDKTVLDTDVALNIAQEVVTDASGNGRYFHTIKAPFKVEGARIGTMGVSRLLDDKVIAQRGIDHEDAKAFVTPIRAIAQSFPAPMLMVDIRQRVINVSPLWERAFGDQVIKPDSLIKDTYPDLKQIHSTLSQCLEQGKAMEDTFSHVGSDGTRKMFAARICTWSYRDGTIGGATIIATDVTPLYDQAAELTQRNDELMQFSYRASHDLKGPLSTAKGLAHFIVEDIAAGDFEPASLNASRIVDLMTKLEQNVVSFLSLARADVQSNVDEDIDLEQMIGDICAGLSLQIKESKVVVQSDLKVSTFFGPKLRIGQILENLMSNAIKYSDPAKPVNFVKVSAIGEGKSGIRLFVEDNGCGVPQDVGQRIFEPFSRFHVDSEGTGLGLAIVKKHVDALNGNIWVQDTDNGTRFCVTLPLTQLEIAS